MLSWRICIAIVFLCSLPFSRAQTDAIPTANATVSAPLALVTFVPDFDANYTIAFCFYHISGNYGLLNRLLFYGTLVFALVASHHEWLVAGALAAALTYSGNSAIHACLLLWHGPAYGELDIQALTAILSASCIVAVPLLNWSTTLRKLGARNIILYWGFLVTVGFLCVFASFYDSHVPTSEVIDGSPWYSFNISCANNTNPEDAWNPTYESYLITEEFVQAHNCSDPCSQSDLHSLFRPDSDLQLLSFAQIDNFFDWPLNKKQKFSLGYEKYGLLMLPYILIQGMWTVFFGRRRPRQIRDNFFIFLKDLHIPYLERKKQGLHKRLAKYWALLIYAWAVFIAVICAPLFIINLVAIELSLASLPESEQPFQIGQWLPWASTGLVLFAALVGRYHHRAVNFLIRAINHFLWRMKFWKALRGKGGREDEERGREIVGKDGTRSRIRPDPNPALRKELSDSAKESAKDSLKAIKKPFRDAYLHVHDEIGNLREFWYDPDKVARYWLRHPIDASSGPSALVAQIHSRSFSFDIMGMPTAVTAKSTRRPNLLKSKESELQAIYLPRPPVLPVPAANAHHPMPSSRPISEPKHDEHIDRTLLPGAERMKSLKKKLMRPHEDLSTANLLGSAMENPSTNGSGTSGKSQASVLEESIEPPCPSTVTYLQIAHHKDAAFPDIVTLRKGSDGVYYFLDE